MSLAGVRLPNLHPSTHQVVVQFHNKLEKTRPQIPFEVYSVTNLSKEQLFGTIHTEVGNVNTNIPFYNINF